MSSAGCCVSGFPSTETFGFETLNYLISDGPAAAPAIGHLKTTLNNLALAATNNTAVLQQLIAANLALTATMATAAYQHILTAGLNIYVLELVVLYLGGSLALLLNGPGRFSFDAGMGPELIASLDQATPAADAAWPSSSASLTPSAIPVESFERAG
jgi:hypothetical protein